jgi:hypothetical protein
MREELRKSAPQLWQVETELTDILAGRPAWCRLPCEFGRLHEDFAEQVGLPLVLDATNPGAPLLSLADVPLEMQKLREAMVQLGAGQMPQVLYFGPYSSAGHYLCGPQGSWVRQDDLERLGFPVANTHSHLAIGKTLDPGYCPGHNPQDSYRRTRPEVEGEAKLTHENGLTILGIWDRSIDKRGGCHSTYIALGLYGFETMCKLCATVYKDRWNKLADRMPIRLVETDVKGDAQ